MPIAHDLDVLCHVPFDDFSDCIPDDVTVGIPVIPAASVRLRETRETMNQMTAGSASRQIGDRATIPPTVGSAMTFLLRIRNAQGFVASAAKTSAVNGNSRMNLIGRTIAGPRRTAGLAG